MASQGTKLTSRGLFGAIRGWRLESTLTFSNGQDAGVTVTPAFWSVGLRHENNATVSCREGCGRSSSFTVHLIPAVVRARCPGQRMNFIARRRSKPSNPVSLYYTERYVNH